MSHTHKDNWKHAIKVDQGYVCLVCGQKYPANDLTIHHKTPRSQGGRSTRRNCVAWCENCHTDYNQKYGTQTSDDYGNPI